jgi:LacI family transcriptional regulator
MRIPDDISIVGFDDISLAAFSIPALTTVRQPLEEMGRIAAQTLLERLWESAPYVEEIAVEPKLVTRRTTGPLRVA